MAKTERTRNENRLFGRHFETVQHIFFPGIMVSNSAKYMVQISLQNSGGKVVFLGWFHGNPPPWGPTGVKVGLPWSLKC